MLVVYIQTKMEKEKIFYTYAYLRENKTPYYIGKGSGNRIYKRSKRCIKPPKNEKNIIFLKTNLSETEAFEHEKYMIALFGRKDLGTGILYNKTNGGEGNSGKIIPEELKKRWSLQRRGRKCSKHSENMKGAKNPMFGRKRTDDEKEKIRNKVLLNNPQRGTFWWNDGNTEIRSKEPPGEFWVRGRISRNRDSNGRFIR